MHSQTRPRPLVLCILDGWGERGGGIDNAIAAADTSRLASSYRALAACAAAGQRALCRPPRRADGQFRGRAHQSRGGPAGLAGSAAHRRRDRLGRARAHAGAAPLCRSAERERRHRPSARAVVAGRRALAPKADRGSGPHRRRGRGAGRDPRFPRRPRHAAEGCPVVLGGVSRRRRRSRQFADRDGYRALLSRWTATSAGTGSKGRIAPSPRARGLPPPTRRARSRRLIAAAKPTNSSSRPRLADTTGCATQTAC